MQLRSYQQQAIDDIYRYFETKSGNPIIVLPTGSGKSLVIAGLCQKIRTDYPCQRIAILSHVKELVQQDYDKMKALWPQSRATIYSASLRQKKISDITFATIQSVFRKPEIFEHIDIMIIDEVHLWSPKSDGMYQLFIDGIKKINPYVKVIGLTASPYRMDSGLLTESGLFTHITTEVTIKELVESGFLSRLISKVSVIQANLKQVRITAGEYNSHDMEEAFGGAFLDEAIPDMMTLSAGRNHGIIFCPTVKFADAVAERLREMGQSAMSISAQTDRETRDLGLAAFKAGMYRWLCSVNLVTTGFDAPIVDCIVLWRATMSPGLYYQMVGRGLRIAPDKADCLVLDYGGNIVTHGPITKIKPPAKKNKRTERPYIHQVKICEVCRSANELDALECTTCGNELIVVRDVTRNLVTKAADVDIMDFSEPVSDWVEVDSVSYHVHKKVGKSDSMRVAYRCGLMVYNEWVFPEHNEHARRKFRQWWLKRNANLPSSPATVKQAVESAPYHLQRPYRICIKQNGKYTEVIDYDFRPLHKGSFDRDAANSFTDSELAPIKQRLHELR